MGDKQFGIDNARLADYAAQIKEVVNMGVEVAIVVGGGNIFRGIQAEEGGMERTQGDYMGMLATMINSMALQAALEKVGIDTRLQSAIEMKAIAEPYIKRRATRHWDPHRLEGRCTPATKLICQHPPACNKNGTGPVPACTDRSNVRLD